MSMFASRTRKTIKIPFELKADGTPHEAEIQKLPGRHLQKAAQAHFNHMMREVSERGGAKVQKEIDLLFSPAKSDAEKQEVADEIAAEKTNPLSGYDRWVLARYGVKSWTCDEPLTPEAIEDLDEEAVEYLATEVMRITKPERFEKAAGDEQKNA